MNTKKEKYIFIIFGIITSFLIAFSVILFAEISITNTQAFAEETSVNPIIIEQGYLLGENKIYRNSEKKIAIGVSSKDGIESIQGIEVEIIQGNIGPSNYTNSSSYNRFVLQDKTHSESILKSLENYQGKNWASLQLNVMIPDYSRTQMPTGAYTIVVTMHRNESYRSQIFFPVSLLDSPDACDINSDGVENTIDLILTLKIANGEITPKESERKKIDTNENGILDLMDTIKVFQCILMPHTSNDSYFENKCEQNDDPIIQLLCPNSGDSNNISNGSNTGNINISNQGNNTNNACTQEDVDPIFKLLNC